MSDNKGRRALGDPPGNPYDYEQKYAEDRYGEEFGPNARVWRVFLDEGRAYDTTIVKGWRDTLDVYLVFTGLFSAVVTTFVVQSSQSLQPDHGEINGSLLSELIAIQRASANGSSVNNVPPSKLTKDSVTADTIDYLANRFWFSSLALSLFAALMAVLMRQWLQEYASAVSGSARHRARVWQYRYLGLNKWKVPLMVALLPMLLHISLLMFFVGLILYIVKSDILMAWVVTALTALFYSLYLLSNILPMVDPQCPYRTPLSHYGYRLFRWAWSKLYYRRSTDTSSSVDQELSTPSAREKHAVGIQREYLAIKSFAWAFSVSSDPSFTTVVVQAAPGLHVHWQADWAQQQILKRLRRQMMSWFCNTLAARGGLFDWTEGRQRRLVQFACTLLLLDSQGDTKEVNADDGNDDTDTDIPDDITSDGGENGILRDCIIRVLEALLKAISSMRKYDSNIPVLEATAFALCGCLRPDGESLSEYFPEIFPAPSSTLNVERRAPTSKNMGGVSIFGSDPPVHLRLHPVVWYHMLTCLSNARYTASDFRLHLALFLWSSMNAGSSASPSVGTKSSDRSVVTLEWLCATKRVPYRKLAQRAIHRLLFGSTKSLDRTFDDNKNEEDDNSLWLPMLRRAIEDYTALVDGARKAKKDSPSYDRIVGVLAHDLGHFLSAEHAIAYIDIAVSVTGRPGVTLDDHRAIFSHYQCQPPSVRPSDDTAVALMRFLIKLLSAPIVIADQSSINDFHLPIVQKMASLVDQPQSQHGPSELLRTVAVGQPEFLQILQPLANTSISNPQFYRVAEALGQVLAAYLDYALQLFRDSTKGTVQHVLAAARGQITLLDAGQPEFLVWCMWVDVINAALAGHSPSALHTTLQGLIGLIASTAALSKLMMDVAQRPLPLALGMALKDEHGRQAFRDFFQNLGIHRTPLDDETILQSYSVSPKKDDDGKVDGDWCRTVMEDCSRRHEGDTLRIGELLTLGEYRDGADRERAAGEQNGDPAGTEPRDWMRSLEAWLYRLRESGLGQGDIPPSGGENGGGDATNRV